jgi:hypothetical protein
LNHLYVIKKQIQNFTFSRAIQFIFLLVILCSQSFFILAAVPNEANAEIPKYCSGQMPGGIFLDRAVNSSPITYTSQQTVDGSPEKITGFTGHLVINYAADSNSLSSNDCQAKFASPRMVIGTSVRSYSNMISFSSFTVEQVNDSSSPRGGSTIKFTGDFNVSNSDLINQSSILGVGEKFADYNFYFYSGEVIADSASASSKYIQVGTGTASPQTVKMGACTTGGPTVCFSLDGTQAVQTGDPINIPLKDIKFFARLNAADTKFKIGDIGSTDGQNFYRTYLDASGKIVPITLNGKAMPAAPATKTFQITGSLATDSKVLFEGGTLEPRAVIALGVGFYNEKYPYSSAGDIGCTKANLRSDAAIFTNDLKEYNWCNFAPKFQAKEVNLKMDGQNGIGQDMVIDNAALAKLMKDIKTLNKSSCTKDSCPETMENANGINYAPFFDLDVTTSTSTAWSALFSSLSSKWNGLTNYFYGLPIVFPSQPVYIMVYPDEATWTAHKSDPIPSWVPKATDAGGSAQINNGSDSSSLYAFIVRVISNIIVWLQSVIYRIFAYMVVPILNALLHVRPYQDIFVNIIYPGWLILRNLANIFFIVSLLVIGLKILFQQSDTSIVRSFIIRLILMALLVNFSLVIGQGIVGIADTVQSQFLPGNTKVIEALGEKLMVEPLKNFRSEVATDSTTFTDKNSEAALSDTIKPIVLLILSIASFFSFIAVAAFLTVRLVMLWVLYMLSPIAYVSFIMKESQSYFSMWWNEFLKQAFLTPILVFFLNIAALMATLFSSNDHSLFQFNVDQSLSGDIVIGSLTIITHFVVLIFIMLGMKFATTFGAAGSKAVVKYAKQGFDTVTKRPAKWAGGVAKDAAKTQWDRNFKGGMLDPFAHSAAFKESVAHKTKMKMDNRLAGNETKLTPSNLYNDPKKAFKYILGGGGVKSASLEASALEKADEAGILTKDERTKLAEAIPLDKAERTKLSEQLGYLDNDQIDHTQAQTDVIDKLTDEENKLKLEKDRRTIRLQKQADDIRLKDSVAADDKIDEKAAVEREYDGRIEQIRTAKSDFSAKLAGSISDGESALTLDKDTKAAIKVVFDSEKVKEDLKEEIDKLTAEIDSLDKDGNLRKKFNYGTSDEMTDEKRKALLVEKQSIDQALADHRMPVSYGATAARLGREKEAEKLIAGMEGDELRGAFKKAMADNNLDLAAAIGKKVAQEGNFDQLLKDHGFKNNVEEFQKFIDQKFAKFAPTVRYQIGSEISSMGEKNGNLAIGKAYKVDQAGNLATRSMDEQLRKVNAASEGKNVDDFFKKKKWEISYQTPTGHKLNEGDIKNLNNFSGAKLDDMGKKLTWKQAKHIITAENKNLIRGTIREKLQRIADGEDV